jgi:hypothetical protein
LWLAAVAAHMAVAVQVVILNLFLNLYQLPITTAQ